MPRRHGLGLGIIGVALAVLVGLGWPVPGAAQAPATPQPTAAPTPALGGTPPPDEPLPPPIQVIRPIPFVPSADYLGTVGGNAAAIALRGVARAPMGGFQHLVERVVTPGSDDDLNVVFFTPAGLSYRAPAVEAVHGTLLRLVLGGVSGLLLLVGAANLALRRRWGLPVDEPGMLLLRLLAASVAALVSLEALGIAVELNNALVRLLLAVPLCEVGADCRPHVFGTLGASFARLTAISLLELDLIELLATLALGIVLLILVIQHIVRIGLLAVLLAIVPLACALWVLPQTRWLARTWASAFVPTLLAQPLQVLAYLLAAGMLASVRSPGQPAPGANVVSVLIGLATLGVSLGLPRLLRAGVSTLESPVRTATKALMLWTLAERLGSALGRDYTHPARPPRRPAASASAAPAGAGGAPTSAGRWTVPPLGLGLGLAPPAVAWASLSASADTNNDTPPVRGVSHTGGDAPHRPAVEPAWDGSTVPSVAGIAPSHGTDDGQVAHYTASLLSDPAATIYFTDDADGGRLQLYEPARGVSDTADRGSFVATFADQRPDRQLSAAEVDALASVASPAPATSAPAGPASSASGNTSAHGTAAGGGGVPSAPTTGVSATTPSSPITLPPPLHGPAQPLPASPADEGRAE